MKGQLLKEIAALTAFGQDRSRDAEDDLYNDGTSAARAAGGLGQPQLLPGGNDDGEGVGAGEWRVEGGKAKEERGVARSRLRMAAGMAALEEEARYRGKKTSRAALGMLMEDDESEESEESEEVGSEGGSGNESSDGSEEDEEAAAARGEMDDGSEAASASEDESDEEEPQAETSSDDDDAGSGSESEADEDGDEDDDLEQDMARLREDKRGMALLLKRSRDEQRLKAEAAKRHRDTWNRLLEVRILLQRLLGMGNRLPRAEGGVYDAYCRAEPRVGEGLDGAASVLRGVLSQLVGLRSQQAAELELEVGGGNDHDDGAGTRRKRPRVGGEQDEAAFTGPLGGRDDPWVASAGDYDRCKGHWVRVLDAAHQRATLSVAVGNTKKFRVVNQGLWHQVEASLADRTRALRRSHLTRAQARAAGLFVGGGGGGDGGGGAGTQQDHQDEEEADEADEEAFDDAELYQLLLRDYIQSVGPAGGVDGVAATAALVGGRLGRKSKRKGVDPKASKGRKLRYAVHPKLENFCFPVPPPPPPMDIDRLFASLPGSSLAATAKGGATPGAAAVGTASSDEE